MVIIIALVEVYMVQSPDSNSIKKLLPLDQVPLVATVPDLGTISGEMPVRFWYILQQDIIIASRNSTSGLQISENICVATG